MTHDAPTHDTTITKVRSIDSRRFPWAAGLVLAAALGGGCSGITETVFTEPIVLAGHEVSAEVLNRGRQDYVTYCIQCHGPLGDGQGHAGIGLWPPARNFQQAQFKFTAIEQGELPTDEELMRIVKGGLNGTPMRQWDISDERLAEIIQYIKTFGRDDWEGEDVEPGELAEMSENPYGADERAAAVALGENVYHAYGCYSCHPTYVAPKGIERATEAILGTAVSPQLRANWHRTELKDSEYDAKVLPPDFTWHPVRTVNAAMPREAQVEQLYRIVAAGINGAAMPAWAGIMPDDQMWGLAYYLQSLMELRNSPERVAFWQRIGIDPTQDVPAYPPPSSGS